MPPPLPDDVRAAILEAIKQGGKSARQIGKDQGVSDAAVRRIAKAEGITDAWSRDKTEQATRARVADMKAARTKLAADLLGDAQRLRERAWRAYTYYERTRDDVVKVTLDEPPLHEVRNAYTALAVCTDKHLALDRHDTDSGAAEAVSMLGALAEGLGQAHRQLTKTEQSDSSDSEAES